MNKKEAIKILRRGGVGLVPTDTLYGVSASAFRKKAVERIYKLRQRNRNKPMIVLIGNFAQLKKFGIRLNVSQKRFLSHHWPGAISVVLPCAARKFSYLHRGQRTLAFRLPAKAGLQRLLLLAGPLTSASANPQGKPPALTVQQAKKYFGDGLDFYWDAGRLDSPASTLVDLTTRKFKILRRGAGAVKKQFLSGEPKIC